VVKFKEVAELVHNDVVEELYGKKEELVVEVEILFLRAATPPRACVTDGDAAIRCAVECAPVFEPAQDETTSGVFVVLVMGDRGARSAPRSPSSPHPASKEVPHHLNV
jgi:hypothetical protein